MDDFTIWARIIHTGPQEFTVVAAAIALHGPSERALVFVESCPSRLEAQSLRDETARKLGADVRARGDRIVDVEIE